MRYQTLCEFSGQGVRLIFFSFISREVDMTVVILTILLRRIVRSPVARCAQWWHPMQRETLGVVLGLPNLRGNRLI